MQYDYLIVGGGVAGVTAAETIRKNDPAGSIVLVCEETVPLYNRILLPNFIKGSRDEQGVFLRKRQDYERNRIEVVWGQRVVAAAPHQATLQNGQTIDYTKVVLAYSGDLRKLEGPVHYLRTLDDAKKIKEAIAAAKQPVIIGDSFIALEFIGVIIERKSPGTLVVAHEQLFPGRFSKAMSLVIENYLVQRNIAIKKNTNVERVEDLAGDFYGAGIGLHFDTALAEQFGAKTNKGIIADEFLQSSQNSWAAGDIAEFHDINLNQTHMLGNWVHAMESGRIAGNNASGEKKPYTTISSYSTQAIGIAVAMAGDPVPNPANKTIVEQGENARAEIFVRDGKTVGAVLVNMPTLIGKVILAIRNKQSWN